MKTLQQFLNDLGARESGGNYRAFNKYGYAGKYQMGVNYKCAHRIFIYSRAINCTQLA